MLPLLIRIQHAETGAHEELGFKRSPVRVGRNHLNDLVLDEGFVSQWHAVVRFDDGAGVRYVDLGSTNGTLLGDERLEKNTELPVEDETPLSIGPLRLTFVRLPLDREKLSRRRRASAFRLGRDPAPEPGQQTVQLTPSHASLPSGDEVDEGATLQASAPSLLEVRDRLIETMPVLQEQYGEYREAWAKLRAGFEGLLEDMPSDAWEGMLSTAIELMPEIVQEKELRQLAGPALPPSAQGDYDIAGWLERLGAPVGEAEQQRRTMERAGAVLETFARAFVHLWRGHRKHGEQLQLDPQGEGSGLDRVEDPAKLLARLLDPDAEEETLDELDRAFADVAMHQVALTNAVVEGGRALMRALSPASAGSAALAKPSPGWIDYVWPFPAASAFFRYVGRHAELDTRDKFTSVLLGSAFRRAYHRISGGSAGESRR